MLDRLLETGARAKTSSWGGAVSVVVHGAIILLAVVSTATGKPPKFTRDGTHVIPINPPVPSAPTASTRHGHTGAGGSRGAVPLVPPVAVPTTIDAGIPGTITTPLGTGADTTLLSEIGSGTGGVPLGGTGLASEATVDVPVRTLVDRAPAYPEMLRAAGISGSVRVQFVVDTTGRAELPSVRVLESSHDQFTRAVLTTLRQSRFTPGEVAGRRVRTLVERSYRFDIEGSRR